MTQMASKIRFKYLPVSHTSIKYILSATAAMCLYMLLFHRAYMTNYLVPEPEIQGWYRQYSQSDPSAILTTYFINFQEGFSITTEYAFLVFSNQATCRVHLNVL